MKVEQNRLEIRGNIGLAFWVLSCLLGSIIAVEVWRYQFNLVPGFYMSISDGILIWGVVTVVSIIFSTPNILTIHFLSKRTNRLGRLISICLLSFYVIVYLIFQELCQSWLEAFYFASPYFFIAFILEYIYLKLERSSRMSEME